ncbi:hypothetical protein R3F64_17810, partial [Halomonas sp. 5021]|uniref:hypothetical protein n=1 Tax=Halomonas sp. 5021 TaxID=3082156 RepID=UPI002FC6EA7E
MRVGVVCEGATDFVVISHFLGSSVESAGINIDIFAIQPPSDNTKKGFFVTSCGFGLIEQAAHRAANQVDHG